MTVKDLIAMEVDVDVYDDVCEELGVAFVGPLELTERGKTKFAEVLDYEVTLVTESYGGLPAFIVHVDDPDDNVWKRKLKMAKEFFDSAAGYCYYEDYPKWFKEE